MYPTCTCPCCSRTYLLSDLPTTRSSEELNLAFFECQCGNTLSVDSGQLKAVRAAIAKMEESPILKCEHCNQDATVTQPNGTQVCEECHDDCPHDDIECGECQECGRHISDFMDEDYGRDR
jgi:hypothetical protein